MSCLECGAAGPTADDLEAALAGWAEMVEFVEVLAFWNETHPGDLLMPAHLRGLSLESYPVSDCPSFPHDGPSAAGAGLTPRPELAGAE